MDYKCQRCKKRYIKNEIKTLADPNAIFRFSKIEKINDERIYLVCEQCTIIVNNYFNNYVIVYNYSTYLMFILAVIFDAISFYFFIEFFISIYLIFSIVFTMLSLILIPINPIHHGKFKRTFWNLQRITIEVCSIEIEDFEKLNLKKKDKICKKEFDMIYASDFYYADYKENVKIFENEITIDNFKNQDANVKNINDLKNEKNHN